MKVFIPGPPIALKRTRMANGHLYDSQKKEKEVVRWQMAPQMEGEKPFSIPLSIAFYFGIPAPAYMLKSVYKGKLVLPQPHGVKPDIDNLVKFYLDCAQGILFEDDKLICSLSASKCYDDKPGTLITIHEVS